MNVNDAKKIAIGIIILIPSLYFLWFGIHLEMPISKQNDVWGQMGDFFGGVMNPLLAFLTIVLLINSINQQNSANSSLNKQITLMEKSEKIKTFENLFFHLIQSQQNLYSKFKISVIEDGIKKELFTIQAVDKLETIIQQEKYLKSRESLEDFYKKIDRNYGIFDILRAFGVTVNHIKEELTDEEGFSANDRKFYYQKLINLTEFAHLRLICIAQQFQSETPTGQKLKDNEFQEVCAKFNLKINDYFNLKD